MVPNSEITIDSTVIIRIVWLRRRPIARSMPSSRVRSSTDSTSVLMTPSTEIAIATSSSTCTAPSRKSKMTVWLPMNSSRVCADHLGAVRQRVVDLLLDRRHRGAVVELQVGHRPLWSLEQLLRVVVVDDPAGVDLRRGR